MRAATGEGAGAAWAFLAHSLPRTCLHPSSITHHFSAACSCRAPPSRTAVSLTRVRGAAPPPLRPPPRFICAARDLLLSAATQEAVTVGVPQRAGTAVAGGPKPSRALFGAPARGQQQQQAASSGSSGLEDEEPLLACGEYAIR